MCQNTNLPVIAACACGAHFRSCDVINALLHITPNSSLSHKWVYIKGNSYVAGRDGKTFEKQILIYGRSLTEEKRRMMCLDTQELGRKA